MKSGQRVVSPIATSWDGSKAGQKKNDSIPSGGAGFLRPISIIGKGSFGVVVAAGVSGTGETVAIKRVRYDSRTVSRELMVLKDVIQRGVLDYRLERDENGLRLVKLSRSVGCSTAGHPNIVRLLCWHLHEETVRGGTETYLHLIMSYLPHDLRRLKAVLANATLENAVEGRPPEAVGACGVEEGERADGRSHSCFHRLLAKVIVFQVARALAFLHHHNICHRDLKPSNVLVDASNGATQLCDFGSAKKILPDDKQRNTAYICSRFYRAPELLFGSTTYDASVDLWSFGCLVAELLRPGGKPLFRGRTTVDQMAEIFKVLGTPSLAEMTSMNPQCAAAMQQVAMRYSSMDADGRPAPLGADESGRDILRIRAKSWERVLHDEHVATETQDLLSRLLCYTPGKRIAAAEVVEHGFFKEIFSEDGQPPHILPTGSFITPSAFALTQEEKQIYSSSFVEKMQMEVDKLRAYTRDEPLKN